MSSKIFVTGGNGFIGSRVVRLLIESGYSVRCFLRATSRTDRISDLDFERVTGDVRDPQALEKGMEGCDGVIHLAGLSSWRDIQSGQMEDVALNGSRNVLAAVKKHGNLRTVFISSLTAVNGTDSPQLVRESDEFTLRNRKLYAYAFAKNEVERMFREAAKEGLPVVIVNPAEVYGPNDRDFITSGTLLDFAESDPVFVCYGGTSIVHIDDVAAGIVAAFRKGKPGERYILGGENLTFTELAAMTLKLLGMNKKIITLPNGLISFIAALGRNLKIPLPFEPAAVPYGVKYWFADNSKARNELGVEFRPAEETLRPTLDWMKENGYIKS